MRHVTRTNDSEWVMSHRRAVESGPSDADALCCLADFLANERSDLPVSHVCACVRVCVHACVCVRVCMCTRACTLVRVYFLVGMRGSFTFVCVCQCGSVFVYISLSSSLSLSFPYTHTIGVYKHLVISTNAWIH